MNTFRIIIRLEPSPFDPNNWFDMQFNLQPIIHSIQSVCHAYLAHINALNMQSIATKHWKFSETCTAKFADNLGHIIYNFAAINSDAAYLQNFTSSMPIKIVHHFKLKSWAIASSLRLPSTICCIVPALENSD